MSQFLITGGAGYVGSHLAWHLHDLGIPFVVFDNLSTGHAAAVPPSATLIKGDLRCRETVNRVFNSFKFDAVFHFAALSQVAASTKDPLRYIDHNVSTSITLLQSMIAHSCHKIVVSSSAAVYGEPSQLPIEEPAAIRPVNPYGHSKAMVEQILECVAKSDGISWAALRYFNAAGADPNLRAGEDHSPETHLIPLAIDAAVGLAPALTVYGDDFPTRDGTAERDYVHVMDLATAHMAALDLLNHEHVGAFNVGTGQGHTVREIINTVEQVAGHPVPYQVGARRPGDPSSLVANASQLTKLSGWRPIHSDLVHMIGDAVRWRKAHPRGYQK
jgi:UDP-glucose 4-epimerase